MRALLNNNQYYGWMPAQFTTLSTANIFATSATQAGAFSFFLAEPKTLSKVRLYQASKTGTPAPSEMVLEVRTDNVGAPSTTVLATATATALAAGAGWVEWDFGAGVELSTQRQYWLVHRNTSATPASNYILLRYFYASNAGGLGPHPFAGSPTLGFHCRSANDGATWTTTDRKNVAACMRLEFSGGEYGGLPIETIVWTSVNGAPALYSDLEAGAVFTTPQNAKMNVVGGTLPIYTSGTPTGSLIFKLYRGATLIASGTSEIPASSINGVLQEVSLVFTHDGDGNALNGPLTLDANTQYRLVAAETTNTDASTKYYAAMAWFFENDASSLALKPLGASATAWDGATWTDTDTIMVPFYLILDADGAFASAGTFPAAYDVRAGVDRGDGVIGTLRGSVRVSGG